MKKLLFPVLLFIGLAVNAQESFFKLDMGAGGVMTLGNFKAYGLSFHLEPKWFFTETISGGFRFEGNIFFEGSIETTSEDVTYGVSSREAFLLKAEYYFIPDKVRPFVAVNTGLYSIASVNAGPSEEASLGTSIRTFGPSVWSFGFAPEAGVTFNNFRISVLFHIIPGGTTFISSTGGDIEVSNNYLVFQLGFKVFDAGK